MQLANTQYCSPGQYATATTCETCLIGNSCSGDDSYYLCSPGTYADSSGLSSWNTSPSGYIVASYGEAGSPVRWNGSEYSLEGSQYCLVCDGSITAVT